ncbi:MAG: MBL fold metallo-hydrolase [Candidatus Riflebacteria bacterium]|nr:MBL fold metallo-hydrolase [Candidatus Riflebacteria bacterium]
MLMEQIPVGGMRNFAYIFGTREGGEGVIVDPGFDGDKIVETAKRLKLNITRIILTHHHFDHVSAASAVKTRTGAKILAHPETERLLEGAAALDGKLVDGDSFSLEPTEGVVKIIHTPGHAPGSICLVVDDKWLITGDTLFIGNCGRTDLPGGDAKTLFNSLQKLKKLPDELILLTGHDYGPAQRRTLGEEKRLNPVLSAPSFEIFDSLL